MKTGWITEEPDEGPSLPVTELLLRNREPVPGGVVETALARSRAADLRQARDEAARAVDPDERAAGLIARGLMPGQISQLSQRLADTQEQLAAEEDKIEKAARRAERTQRMHERGQIDALGIAQRWRDTDEGDPATVERLRRRAASLWRQITEAQALAAGPEARARSAVEESSARARQILAEVTAQRAADDAAESAARSQIKRERGVFYAARDGRLFGDAGDGTEHTGPDCQVCAAAAERDAARARADFVAVYGEITRVSEGGRNYMGVGELHR